MQIELEYVKHKISLLNLCKRYSKEYAEDLLHDSFLKIIKNKERITGDAYLYMFVVVKNTCMNFVNRSKRYYPLDFIPITYIDYNFILDAIEKLSPGCNKVFVMRESGFTHKEISSELGIEEVSSRTQYFKARKQLLRFI